MSGRYSEEECLGNGRLGSVYASVDCETGRRVVLRRFEGRPRRFGEQRWHSEFYNAVEDLRRLNHANVLRILDGGVDSKGAFLVSERVEGSRLSKMMEKGKGLELKGVYELARQMLDAYDEAATYGFHHYALSPGSVLGLREGDGSYHFTLMDLGHSRLLPLLDHGGTSRLVGGLDPALMAPEVFEERPEASKSSLYMLGQLLYWVCAGCHPLAGLSLAEANAKHKAGEIPYLRGYRADLSESFRKWISYLIQPDLGLRLRSVKEAKFLMPSYEDFEKEVEVKAPRRMSFEDL